MDSRFNICRHIKLVTNRTKLRTKLLLPLLNSMCINPHRCSPLQGVHQTNPYILFATTLQAQTLPFSSLSESAKHFSPPHPKTTTFNPHFNPPQPLQYGIYVLPPQSPQPAVLRRLEDIAIRLYKIRTTTNDRGKWPNQIHESIFSQVLNFP